MTAAKARSGSTGSAGGGSPGTGAGAALASRAAPLGRACERQHLELALRERSVVVVLELRSLPRRALAIDQSARAALLRRGTPWLQGHSAVTCTNGQDSCRTTRTNVPAYEPWSPVACGPASMVPGEPHGR